MSYLYKSNEDKQLEKAIDAALSKGDADEGFRILGQYRQDSSSTFTTAVETAHFPSPRRVANHSSATHPTVPIRKLLPREHNKDVKPIRDVQSSPNDNAKKGFMPVEILVPIIDEGLKERDDEDDLGMQNPYDVQNDAFDKFEKMSLRDLCADDISEEHIFDDRSSDDLVWFPDYQDNIAPTPDGFVFEETYENVTIQPPNAAWDKNKKKKIRDTSTRSNRSVPSDLSFKDFNTRGGKEMRRMSKTRFNGSISGQDFCTTEAELRGSRHSRTSLSTTKTSKTKNKDSSSIVQDFFGATSSSPEAETKENPEQRRPSLTRKHSIGLESRSSPSKPKPLARRPSIGFDMMQPPAKPTKKVSKIFNTSKNSTHRPPALFRARIEI